MNRKQKLIAWLVYLITRVLKATYRFEVGGNDHRKAAEATHKAGSFCLALWHEHLFGAILGHAHQRFAPLASLSSDGDIVTYVMAKLDFETVRGSSSRGGEAARDDMVRKTDDGWFTAITVDGPRGPRRRLKGGVIDVARRTGVAILPVAVVASRHWELRSWDKFKIPKPFARVIIQYAPPLVVPADTTGLAFGEAKNVVKHRMEEAERLANLTLRPAGPP